MPTLENYLNSLNFSTQLEVVKNLIVDSSSATITFWGCRVIQANGFSGSVNVDDVARKILDAGKQRCVADDLTTAERVFGIDIVKKLQKFYKDTDVQIQNSNPLTKFLNLIREFRLVPYTARFFIDDEGDKDFRGYSPDKFLQQFGGSFGEQYDHPASNGSFGRPFRVLAREDRIRELLVRV